MDRSTMLRFSRAMALACLAGSFLAVPSEAQPSKFDPTVEQFVRTLWPGRAVEKVSLTTFQAEATRYGLFQQVEAAEATREFRRIQDAACMGAWGARTRNTLFTLPVPAHPSHNLFQQYGSGPSNDTPLNEQEPNNSAASANPMTCADTMDGNISTPTDVDVFTFTLAQPHTIDIFVVTTGHPDTRLSVYDANYQRIAFNDDSNGTDPGLHMVFPAGRYYLAVESHDPYTQTGTYTVNLNCSPMVLSLPLGTTVNGTFAAQIDTYTLTLAQASWVEITANATMGSSAIPNISVAGPNGFDRLASRDNFLRIHLPAGTHYVHMSNSSVMGGTYDVRAIATPAPIQTLTYGTPISSVRTSLDEFEMVSVVNPQPTELRVRQGRGWAFAPGTNLVVCDSLLQTTEGGAGNLTGTFDAENFMGVPEGRVYIVLDPIAAIMQWSTRQGARRLSFPGANHPGPLTSSLTGTLGRYVAPATNSIKIRFGVEADWTGTGNHFSWTFDQAVTTLTDGTGTVQGTALRVVPQTTGPSIFRAIGNSTLAPGALDTANSVYVDTYFLDNQGPATCYQTWVEFDFNAVGINPATLNRIDVTTLQYLAGHDASVMPGPPAGSTVAGFRSHTRAPVQIWNVNTGGWDEFPGGHAHPNGVETIHIDPNRVPPSGTCGPVSYDVTANNVAVRNIQHLGDDHIGVPTSYAGEQSLFSWRTVGRTHAVMRTFRNGTDPQAYFWYRGRAGTLLKAWQDDQALGSNQDPYLTATFGTGDYLLVMRNWTSCCTGTTDVTFRSFIFNILGRPTVGQSNDWVVSGPAGAPFVVVGAAGGSPVPIPIDGSGIIGDIAIDFGTFATLYSGVLGPLGENRTSIMIPNQPFFQGARFGAQGAVIHTFVPLRGELSSEAVVTIQ